MKVFLNPGHAPNGIPDPGACGNGLRECDIAKAVTDLVSRYLTSAGVEVVGNMQDDSLYEIVNTSNNLNADVFVSVHCNAFNGAAHGTETWHYFTSKEGKKLAKCIQDQLIDSLGTTDRGIKGAEPGRNGLYVLTNTDAVSALVEIAFIDNPDDADILKNRQDDIARAIARGITDYELIAG